MGFEDPGQERFKRAKAARSHIGHKLLIARGGVSKGLKKVEDEGRETERWKMAAVTHKVSGKHSSNEKT